MFASGSSFIPAPCSPASVRSVYLNVIEGKTAGTCSEGAVSQSQVQPDAHFCLNIRDAIRSFLFLNGLLGLIRILVYHRFGSGRIHIRRSLSSGGREAGDIGVRGRRRLARK